MNLTPPQLPLQTTAVASEPTMTKDDLRWKVRRALGGACVEPGPRCDFNEDTGKCTRRCPEIQNKKVDHIMSIFDAYERAASS